MNKFKLFSLVFLLLLIASKTHSQRVSTTSLNFGTVMQDSEAKQTFTILNVHGNLGYSFKKDCNKCYKIKFAGHSSGCDKIEVIYNTKTAGAIDNDITIVVRNFGNYKIHLSGYVVGKEPEIIAQQDRKTHTNKIKYNCKLWNFNENKYIEVRWKGKIDNGYAIGKGKAKWADGNATGYAVNGKLEGYGVFEGSFFKYEGGFKNGERDGYGVFTRNDFVGSYAGNYKNNLANGQGVFTYGKKDYFTGNFVDNKPEGVGYLKKDGILTKMLCVNGNCSSEPYNKSEESIATTIVGTAIAAIIVVGGFKAISNYYRENAKNYSYNYSPSYSSSSSSSSSTSSTTSQNTSNESSKTETNKNYGDCVKDRMDYIKYSETLNETPLAATSYECPCEVWMDKGNQWTPTFYKIISSGKWYYGTFGPSGPFNSLEDAVKAYCKEKNK